MMIGRKDDQEKPDWNLVPWNAMDEITKVLTHGAKKYSPDNWKHVKPFRRRYFAAAMRHLIAWFRGERLDPDSGYQYHHLACAMCCLLFLLEKEMLNERD